MRADPRARFVGSIEWVLAAVAAALLGAPAHAQLTTYQFTLTYSPYAAQVANGSGFFVVNESQVPDVGSFAVVAADLAGKVSNYDFGYAFGNSAVYGTPIEPIVVRSVHGDATISFLDGVPTGITYSEQHVCFNAYHCGPYYQVNLTGTEFSVSAYPFGSGRGELSISAAVPEPSTYALLLAGLGATILMRRRRIYRRVASAMPASTNTAPTKWNRSMLSPSTPHAASAAYKGPK